MRASSHSNLYTSPTRVDTRTSPTRLDSRNGTSPTAGLGRALDGIWSDTHFTTSQDANAKLSELLRKHRQSKLWK